MKTSEIARLISEANEKRGLDHCRPWRDTPMSPRLEEALEEIETRIRVAFRRPNINEDEIAAAALAARHKAWDTPTTSDAISAAHTYGRADAWKAAEMAVWHEIGVKPVGRAGVSPLDRLRRMVAAS